MEEGRDVRPEMHSCEGGGERVEGAEVELGAQEEHGLAVRNQQEQA